MTYLARIATRVLNRPLLVHPQTAQTIAMVLGGRIGLADHPTPESNRLFGERSESGGYAYRVIERVAVIPAIGELINRGAWIGASSGLVSYEGVAAQIALALGDKDVDAIVLDIDSPGGEVAGIERLADDIAAAREQKPVVAFVNDMAASAAYWLASQADQIMVSTTSMVGSIGVVVLHVDASGQLEDKGLKPTLIFAGAHKVDGHPFGPLPDTVASDLQAEVNAYYEQFLAGVARGRGSRFSAEQARETQARVLIGADAVSAGMADVVGGFTEAIALARSLISGPAGQQQRRGMMPDENNSPQAMDTTSQVVTDTVSRAEHDAAVTAARDAGASAERDRFAAILGDEKVKGREGAALDLAIKSPSMAATDVVDFVANNVSAPDASGADFTDRMNAIGEETKVGASGAKPRPASIDTAGIYNSRATAVRG